MSFLYLKCGFAGISGDLFLSALADLIGIDTMKSYLEQILKNLSQVADFQIDIVTSSSKGMAGKQLKLIVNEQPPSPIEKISNFTMSPESHLILKSSSSSSTENSQSNIFHSDHQPQSRHQIYSHLLMREDLKNVMELGHIPPAGIELGLKILDIIIHAEAAVHGKDVKAVHLHEIGAIDTILDIAASIYGLTQLGVFNHQAPTSILADPIAVGGGFITTAHGRMAVPAPASLKILDKYNISIHHGPENFELATPTGIAIVAGLKLAHILTQRNPERPYTIQKVGIGVGHYQLKKQANILQIYLGQYQSLNR